MANFSLEQILVGEVVILEVTGYYDIHGGANVLAAVGTRIEAGTTKFILDLTACKIVNSSGVASIMDLAGRVVDDDRGRLVVIGIDTLKERVFKMAGILGMVERAESREEALAFLKKP